MIRRLTGLVFFLLVGQFCAQAQNWVSVGNGLTGSERSMVADSANHKIYTSGYWGSNARFLQYNDSNGIWSPLGNAVPNNTFAITVYRGEIYGAAFLGIYKLAGQTWQLVAPTHGQVLNFYLHDTDLYAVGNFDSIAGIQAKEIAKYDGTSWHNLGVIPMNGAINCATFYQGELYVGGNIDNSPLGIYCIMKWNGNQWLYLPSSNNSFTGGATWIDCMTVYNNELYVGGYFYYGAGGNPGNNIAKWNGSTWNAVGGGFDFQAMTMEVYNGDLWVGGSFTNAGGIPASYIAKWNGTDWCNVGDFDNGAYCFCQYNGELYVGGGSWVVDGDSINKVVKWIGGNNTGACGHLTTGIEEKAQNFSVRVFPNPTNTTATFQLTGIEGETTIRVFDQLGQEIWRKESSENNIEFPAENFAAGLYFYLVEQKGESIVKGKFIIQ